MLQPRLVYTLLIPALLAFTLSSVPQTSPTQITSPYRVAVDEVVLTFHASDTHGLPINDLKLDELTLLDNNKPPRKILAFESLQNHPIRAGILIDTSQSMERHLHNDRAISTQYAQRILRQQTDQAFLMDFGYASRIILPWTSDPIAVTAGIHRVIAGRENPLGGTALFDTIYRACFYEFGKVDHPASGNFILLFSDGEDNTSHTSLNEAVDICQRANTAIYAFRPAPEHGYSSGPKTLADLTSQTGGCTFFDDDPEDQIDNHLRTIESDLRNQYRLVYKPAELTHDGSFHRVELRAPPRVDNITIRSGYYAPSH